jgi:protein O-mannosyl-transferase
LPTGWLERPDSDHHRQDWARGESGEPVRGRRTRVRRLAGSQMNSLEDGRRETPTTSWSVVFLLVLLVAAIYAQSVNFDSLDFDDQEYVYANPHVLDGLTGRGFVWALTAFHSANWHPLTWISHMLDVELFGPAPGPHHLVNVLLHAANAVALFLVLKAATSAFWPSAMVAALFAVHPLNAESVAWISQRKSLLSTLFLFLAMGAYVSWTRRRGVRRGLLVVLLLGLGLLAKPMLVTTPLLLLAFDFWPLERGGNLARNRALLVEKAPLFAVAAGASLATVLAQSAWKAVGSTAGYPLGDRLGNALVSTVSYLRDAVWPANLACFYPHPATLGERIRVLPALGAAALLAGITALAVAARRRRPWLLFGWTWYLVALSPVIGLVQVGSQARADRYTYVPMVGIFVAGVWEIASRVREERIPAAVAATAGAVVVGTLGIRAFAQAGTWRDGESLYTNALRVTENNWLASNNLGNFWLSHGQPKRALEAFQGAARMKPDYEEAYYNEGVALTALSRPAEAVEAYREGLRLSPGNTDGWVNLGFALLSLRRVPEGLQAYEKALTQRPDDPMALYGAAVARATLGDPVAALQYLARLQRVDPSRAAALRRDLGVSK